MLQNLLIFVDNLLPLLLFVVFAPGFLNLLLSPLDVVVELIFLNFAMFTLA